MFNLNNYDYEIKIIKMCPSHMVGTDTVVYYNFRTLVKFSGRMRMLKKRSFNALY